MWPGHKESELKRGKVKSFIGHFPCQQVRVLHQWKMEIDRSCIYYTITDVYTASDHFAHTNSSQLPSEFPIPISTNSNLSPIASTVVANQTEKAVNEGSDKEEPKSRMFAAAERYSQPRELIDDPCEANSDENGQISDEAVTARRSDVNWSDVVECADCFMIERINAEVEEGTENVVVWMWKAIVKSKGEISVTRDGHFNGRKEHVLGGYDFVGFSKKKSDVGGDELAEILFCGGCVFFVMLGHSVSGGSLLHVVGWVVSLVNAEEGEMWRMNEASGSR